MRDGLLCRRWHDPDPARQSFLQVVVPYNQRAQLLTRYHDESGHLGEDKTLMRLRSRFHWYGMRRDVVAWVCSCCSCSQRKSPRGRGRGAPLVSTWCGFPWERVAMDLIPNLPMTKRGNRHLLVIIDYFTKWAEAFPLANMTAETISTVFLNEIVARYGAPCSAHTDQGRNLDGRLFRDICTLLGIHKTHTTPYHPAGDGLVERLNQTIEKMLSHYVSTSHDDWDLHVPKVMMAYRSAVQSSASFTPHYLMFGREMRLPCDVAYGLPPDRPLPITPPASVWKLRERLVDAHSLVRDRLPAVHRHQKAHYDGRAVPVSFQEGDSVWLMTPSMSVGQSSKFRSPWHGPYEVVDRLSNGVNYRLCATWPPHRVVVSHVNRMKLCLVRPQHLTTLPEAPLEPAPVVPPPVPPTTYVPDATDLLYEDDSTSSAEQWPAVAPPPVLGRPQRVRRMPQRFADYVDVPFQPG